jgi:hypothetical protein
MTRPLMKAYAGKMGARYDEIESRWWPDRHWMFEKFQLYSMSEGWSIYVDGDCLIHPDMFDVTSVLSPDTVLQACSDVSLGRFEATTEMRRDGRWISSCNFFTVWHEWCLDLWKLPDSYDKSVLRIHPTTQEQQRGVSPEHLIDDCILTQNIARFGLKYMTLSQLQAQIGDSASYIYHAYLGTTEDKTKALRERMKVWRL